MAMQTLLKRLREAEPKPSQVILKILQPQGFQASHGVSGFYHDGAKRLQRLSGATLSACQRVCPWQMADSEPSSGS